MLVRFLAIFFAGLYAGALAQVPSGRYGVAHAVADFQNLAFGVTAVVVSGIGILFAYR